jgi:hypothetical protein
MLADRELATIRAALGYWRDEMTPHGTEAQAPYFDEEGADPLSAADIGRLHEALRTAAVRRARFEGLTALRLLSAAEAASAVDRERLAVVLIPPQDAPGADESLAGA